jgi:CheY-like chemotaxis protein
LSARLLSDAERAAGLPPPSPRAALDLVDDVSTIEPTDRVLLIVENDSGFARILLELAHEASLKAVVATRGDAALALARRFQPVAITLDLRLPDMSGSQVLEALKHNAETRDVPVHVISGVAEGHDHILELGAASYWLKPVDAPAVQQLMRQIAQSGEHRKILVAADRREGVSGVTPLVEVKDAAILTAASGAHTLDALREDTADCVILPLELTDMPCTELLAQMARLEDLARLPVFIYSSQVLDADRKNDLRQAGAGLALRILESPERLREELRALFNPPILIVPSGRPVQKKVESADLARLAGKRVLVVDDDVRNIFALTSLLERYKIEVSYADNGRSAISMLKETPGIDIVLMDIMMPEMDGFEAMREIRKLKKFRKLPIIALTARAMKGDREKCIEAGASDYIPKPVAPDQLLSVLCAWAPGGDGSPESDGMVMEVRSTKIDTVSSEA